MSEIEHFPFEEDMTNAADIGMKCCTTRTKPNGRKGDTFPIRRRQYEIIAVEKLPLGYVAKYLYHFEGFESEEAFIKKWIHLHPIKGWLSTQEGYVHWFRPKLLGPMEGY